MSAEGRAEAAEGRQRSRGSKTNRQGNLQAEEVGLAQAGLALTAAWFYDDPWDSVSVYNFSPYSSFE